MTSSMPAPTVARPTGEPPTESLLVASVDELRVLTAMAGAVLPPVFDGDPGAGGRTLADVVAVRSLLARGWFTVDDDDGGVAPAPEVSAALGSLVGATAVVELEVRADDELRRLAYVTGPAGDRRLAETFPGVWSVSALGPRSLTELDEAVSASLVDRPEPGGTVGTGGAGELDRDAVLEAGGHEVVLRRARRLGPERYQAEELHWVVGSTGCWLIEPADAEGDLDADGTDEVAAPIDADHLDELLIGLLAAAGEDLRAGAGR